MLNFLFSLNIGKLPLRCIFLAEILFGQLCLYFGYIAINNNVANVLQSQKYSKYVSISYIQITIGHQLLTIYLFTTACRVFQNFF